MVNFSGKKMNSVSTLRSLKAAWHCVYFRSRESESEAINALIRHFPLATVVVRSVNDTPQANHYPLLLEVDAAGGQKLCGHLPKYSASEISHAQASSAPAIFQGPSAYVSSSFYPSKALTGKVVPT